MIAISLWENKVDAETYNTKAYPDVLKTLGKIYRGNAKGSQF